VTLGVTIGKFFPFHLGHDLLVREAKARCDRLVVLVGWKPGQALPGELRAGWIREAHPDVEVLLVLEDVPDAPEPWARRTLEELRGRRPDVAFTSEPYGEPWAAAMGCRHEAIDVARARVPTSGTALREDLGANWEFLTPPAKAHFARRVVVLGVESSGTTTLAAALAERFRTVCVPEVGRAWWEARRHLQAPWTEADFLAIARGQAALEDDLARLANRTVICDTDPLATTVWHRRYLGRRTVAGQGALEAFAATRTADLHLLTAPDFPFVQDGTREDGPHRAEMHGWFKDALSGRPFLELTGSPEARLAAATAAIEPLLRWAPHPAP
jgi:HTH-type transcriptional repressor of NAD biosynthesis genes